MWTNYHGHCHYCDGLESVENHVQAALQQGISILGLSCHAPVKFRNVWSMSYENVEDYLEEITIASQKYAGKITLMKSMEVDHIPDMLSPTDQYIRSLQLDYTVGSVHFVGSFDNGTPWEIDSSYKFFLKGLKEIYKDDIKKAVSTYFDLIRQMVSQHCPDIIGHLDKIKMQNIKGGLWGESEPWYQREIEETLNAIKRSGAVVEINTRGIYKGLTTEPYPSYQIIKKMDEMGIPLCINSDAHTPQEITKGFTGVARNLLEMGVKHLHYYDSKEWRNAGLSAEGLLL